MTDDLHAMLKDWLEHGTPEQRQHAVNRLAMPDAIGYEPRPMIVAPPLPMPVYPPLAKQARNLAGSLVRWVASGCGISTAAEARRRRGVCVACPSGLYDPARGRCTACGCKTAVKPWLNSETCPRGHW